MMAAVDDVLARAYPTRTWGEVDDGLLVDSLSRPCDGPALAEELAADLNAAAFYVAGRAEDLCDYVYVLALGRTPCILQVRELGVAPPPDWDAQVDELYLRVCLSNLAPLAAVHQVAMSARRADGGWLVGEASRAGVYDAPLLRRLQRLVAILPAYDLVSVDFGDISAPPPGFAPGAWPSLYGAPAPALANYLFFPEPATMTTTTFLPTMDGACSTTR